MFFCAVGAMGNIVKQFPERSIFYKHQVRRLESAGATINFLYLYGTLMMNTYALFSRMRTFSQLGAT